MKPLVSEEELRDAELSDYSLRMFADESFVWGMIVGLLVAVGIVSLVLWWPK